MSRRQQARGHAICGKASCSANGSEDVESLQHDDLYMDHPECESSVSRSVSAAAFDRDQRAKRKNEGDRVMRYHWLPPLGQGALAA
jgi:hypothetical protein